MFAFYINCKEKDYVEEIFNKRKLAETKSKPTLRKYIGQRVGIIKSGKGESMMVGYATIVCETTWNTEGEFRNDYCLHRVEKGSEYDFCGKKYGYFLSDVERCKPFPVDQYKMIGRTGREIMV